MDFTENGILKKVLAVDDSQSCMTDSCSMPDSTFPEKTPLAMSYVPFQSWETTYDSDAGLSRGTVFPSLDKPFIGEEAVCSGKN